MKTFFTQNHRLKIFTFIPSSGLDRCQAPTVESSIVNITSNQNLSSFINATSKPLTTLITTLANHTSSLVNQTSNSTSSMCDNVKPLSEISSPSKEFWERHVLQITDSIGDAGKMRSELVLCLIIGWVLVYLCLFKGIKSSGKVSCCFPRPPIIHLLLE